MDLKMVVWKITWLYNGIFPHFSTPSVKKRLILIHLGVWPQQVSGLNSVGIFVTKVDYFSNSDAHNCNLFHYLYFNEIVLAINTALCSLAMSRTGNTSTDFTLLPSNFQAFISTFWSICRKFRFLVHRCF